MRFRANRPLRTGPVPNRSGADAGVQRHCLQAQSSSWRRQCRLNTSNPVRSSRSSVLVLGYHRVFERHEAVECGLLERNLEEEQQHPSRADLLAAWERHDFGSQIAGSSDGGAYTRYEHLPAFGGEDGRDDEVAHRAKRRADHAVEARLLRAPLAQVHASVWHLVGVVNTLGDVLVEPLLGAHVRPDGMSITATGMVVPPYGFTDRKLLIGNCL